MIVRLAATLFLLALPAAAVAQDTNPPGTQAPEGPQGLQGPMTLERVHNGFAVAPDFRITKVDGSSARLAGAYGGWVFDNTLLVGGGGYWLTNRSRDFDMAYGGAVVQWLQRTGEWIGFGARGLVGAGEATLPGTVAILVPQGDRDGDRDGHRTIANVRGLFRRRDFFIAEPQADLLVRLTRHLRLEVGAGYRLIGGADGFADRLRGASGSIALQVGTSSTERQ